CSRCRSSPHAHDAARCVDQATCRHLPRTSSRQIPAVRGSCWHPQSEQHTKSCSPFFQLIIVVAVGKHDITSVLTTKYKIACQVDAHATTCMDSALTPVVRPDKDSARLNLHLPCAE